MSFPPRALPQEFDLPPNTRFLSLQNPDGEAIIGGTIGGAVARGAGQKPNAGSVRTTRASGQASEGLLSALLSRLGVGVLAADRHGKVLDTNPAWWRLLRLPRRQLRHKGLTTAFPHSLRPHVQSLVEDLQEKNGPVELALAEGGLHIEASRWRGGLLLLLTEQPLLLQERGLTQKILDSLPLGLYVIDRSFTIVAWNRTRETGPPGMRREDVIGRNLFQVLPSLRRTQIEEEFRLVFETGATPQVEEESDVEGERRTFRISKVPLTDGRGDVTHVITLVEDITERRRIERQLLASEKLAGIGQLASGIAHELNNPMATIASCAEALLKHSQNPTPALENAEYLRLYPRIIEDEVYRCKGVLAGLSDLSREGSGELRPVDLRVLLEGTLRVLGYQIRSRGITVTQDFDVELPLLLGNEGELRQACLALLINAIEAMDAGGILTVRARTTGPAARAFSAVPIRLSAHGVQVEIEDTGRGVPPDLLPRVFEPFFSTKPPGKGAGLGLYIAEGIVSAHGGRIDIHSVEGKWTVVRVYFPPAKTQVSQRR